MISTAIKMALSVVSCTLLITSKAQTNKWSKFEVGGGVSAFVYQGDLTPRRLGSFETIKPGFLVFGNYKLNNQLKVQAAFAMGWLKGDDAKYKNPAFRQERNFLFTTSVKEVSAKLIYDIYKPYKGDEALLFPYIGAGLGLNFFNIKKDYSRLTTKLTSAEPNILTGLAADDSKKLPRLLITIPVVVGVRKMVTERIDFFTELNYRFVFTDYLDGFSQAANPKEKDKFYSINVGVVYKFRKNNSIGCPAY